VIASRPFACTE